MILTAFIMGLAGSFHCAAMCGPLALAVPTVPGSILASRLAYNFGRIACYGGLGVLFGAIGQTLALAGFQRWLSIAAGVAMLAVITLGVFGFRGPIGRVTLWIKSLFGGFLHRRTYPALLALGAVNGLLPCGLVYLAGTASTGYGNMPQAILYMFVFGTGTLPVMLGVALGRKQLLAFTQRFRLQPLTPIVATLVAAALILRGMSLGIPYLSPVVSETAISCPSCAIVSPKAGS